MSAPGSSSQLPIWPALFACLRAAAADDAKRLLRAEMQTRGNEAYQRQSEQLCAAIDIVFPVCVSVWVIVVLHFVQIVIVVYNSRFTRTCLTQEIALPSLLVLHCFHRQANGGNAPLPAPNIDALAAAFVSQVGGGHMDPYRTVVYYTLTHANGAGGNQARATRWSWNTLSSFFVDMRSK